ncbi:nuclease [Rhodoblastus sphagnicola]|uniref:Phospholipase D n=1 Tax=Rhodoblastus sphagnicola TaxID=333368 RepID=A0A2S6NBE7_9HYPH|nr:phospholipase D-like domain-containing protein [Rhodoblastus sphagnicola]MBB4197721.1 phosphatidylserine/phosphatidylglycerophosphate/cardiolipin synthase-like enzyme [Rhodoblastus sphagnicola]PPQ31914.1 nuclease [Rhodoblastus sphagnicola]
MKALAFSNNDIAVIAWSFDKEIEGCLGFSVHRIDVHAGTETPLPAMATFPGESPRAGGTTEQAPVQKFWWKDLGAAREVEYRYKIVPLSGAPGALKPLDGVAPLETNTVVLSPKRGSFRAYFNRGIVATPAVTRALGTPSVPRLMRHLANPDDKLRKMLCGQLFEGLTELLDRADGGNGEIRAALYELNDPDGLEIRLQAKDKGDPKARAVVLGNERSSDGKGADREVVEDVDSDNRAALKAAGVPVADRILPDQHIPHNKFLILKQDDKPAQVLTGSTNWTMNALAAQTNNGLVIDNAEVAALYQAYWDQLEKDTGDAQDDSDLQGPDFRKWVRAANADSVQTPVTLDDGAKVHVFFAPSTKVKSWNPKARRIEDPADMGFVFDLMRGAKQAILFLAFDPGNKSILDVAGETLAANPHLFVRGALTSPQRAANFAAALKGHKGSDAPDGDVGLIGEGGSPGSETEKGDIDYRAIPAGHVGKDDAFGAWEAELLKAGHAIIHDKIVVIDPFDDDCVVVTGSHNLGYRASHNNDENFVVVQGHKALAQAYACHVLDVYDHYAWRYWLHINKSVFGKPLDTTDHWQARYFKGGKPVSAELNFWLGANAG